MEPALAIFAPLLGKCFAATLAPETVDRHCFTSVYDGAHVRDTHVVTAKGKPVYSGESIYSFDGKGWSWSTSIHWEARAAGRRQCSPA